MMYYGGAGWLGWIVMGFSMIAFWAVVITLVVWGVSSFSRDAQVKPRPSAALGILQERFAKGEISKEEYTQRSQMIGGAR